MLRRQQIAAIFAIALLALAWAAPPTPAADLPGAAHPTPAATTTPTCGRWAAVPYRGVSGHSGLQAVAATGANDAWAIGYQHAVDQYGPITAADPLLLHWNGSRWLAVTPPDLRPGYGSLRAVAARSRSDVWVVGEYQPSNGVATTLILHWNGSRWARIPSPTVAGQSSALNAIVALNTTDAWAVGSAGIRVAGEDQIQGAHTLVLHWDGKRWSEVAAPSPGNYTNQLQTITATGPKDIWALGYTIYRSKLDSPPPFHTNEILALHWDGRLWSREPAPTLGTTANAAVSLSRSNTWAVGAGSDEGSSVVTSAHWDGRTWATLAVAVPTPRSGEPSYDELHAVAAVSSANIWAVGSHLDRPGRGPAITQILTVHWDGSRWQTVSSLNPATADNRLTGVTAVPGSSSLWAVGGTRQESDGGRNALILRYLPQRCTP